LVLLLSVLFRLRKRGKSEYESIISRIGVGGADDGGEKDIVDNCSIIDEFE
jgi:hypothetical protein